MATIIIAPDRTANVRRIAVDPRRTGNGCALLDANNGRLRGALDVEPHAHLSASVYFAEQPQTRRALRLVAGAPIDSLKARMRLYGFMPSESLAVFPLPLPAAPGKRSPGVAYVVAEGNCRLLAATEALDEDERAATVIRSDAPDEEKDRYRRFLLTPAVRQSLRSIPATCIEADAREDMLAAVNLVVEGAHVVGKTPWSSYASGCTILFLFDAGLSIAEIAKKLGENEQEVVRRLRTVSLLRQLKQHPALQTEILADLYGHAHELLERRGCREWLVFDQGDRSDPARRPTFLAQDASALEHVAQLLVRKRYTDDVRRALPVAQRDVRRLRLVLEHEDREGLLQRIHGGDEKGWEILTALEEARRPVDSSDRSLERLLRRAANMLSEADDIARKSSAFCENAEALTRDITLHLARLQLSLRHAAAGLQPEVEEEAKRDAACADMTDVGSASQRVQPRASGSRRREGSRMRRIGESGA